MGEGAVEVIRGAVPAPPAWPDGSGDGYGSGSGDGSGSGSGYGYGYGDGYGSGSGYGYGSGSGYGYGSGYGDGDGYGDSYWNAVLDSLPETRPATAAGATVGFWRSDADGRPCNGGRGTQAEPGLKEEVPGPLSICTRNALHATLDPFRWQGERLWVVALYGEVQRQEDKMAALKREILCEVKL